MDLRAGAAFVFLVLASGCAAGPDEPVAAPVASPTSQTPAPQPPVVRTDTLHLLASPHMAAQLPADGPLIRTPVPADTQAAPNLVEPVTWRLPEPAVGQLVASLRLVVDVQGIVAPYAYPLGLGVPSGACFWHVILHFASDDVLEDSIASQCIVEPPTVPTGIRTLEVRFVQPDFAQLARDEDLQLSLYAAGIYGPGATVDVLSGTLQHDSTLTIEGYRLPLTTQTLL